MKAIYAEDDLPVEQQVFLALNAELSQIWPNINVQKAAPADAAQWDGVPDKRSMLAR